MYSSSGSNLTHRQIMDGQEGQVITATGTPESPPSWCYAKPKTNVSKSLNKQMICPSPASKHDLNIHPKSSNLNRPTNHPPNHSLHPTFGWKNRNTKTVSTIHPKLSNMFFPTSSNHIKHPTIAPNSCIIVSKHQYSQQKTKVLNR